MFGSCRIGSPQPTEFATQWPEDLQESGIDALWTYAKQLQRGESEWPDAVLLLGDQVYADEVSPATLDFIRSRRDTESPGEQIAFEEEHTLSTANRGRTPTSAGCLHCADHDDLR